MGMVYSNLWILSLHLLVLVAVVVRVLQRPHRAPASRIAWLVVVLALPVIGIVAYLMLGETHIGRRNQKAMLAKLGEEHYSEYFIDENADESIGIPSRYVHLFRVGRSISNFAPVAGNSAQLMRDSAATIDSMVSDIDAARSEVNLLFYIWLNDNSGVRVAEALKRAASRGVTCRAIVDGLGSRVLTKSRLWREMGAAGVCTAVALPLGNVFLRPLQGRVDLRNHRKIVVVDGQITYCGSQNCADKEFRPKAKYGPWVDSVVRMEGPIARQNQILFTADWHLCTNEVIGSPTEQPQTPEAETVVAQVIASGPTLRHSAMEEVFISLMFSARHELTISTPYYVPNQPMQAALCAAAYRGVQTTLILPARNDSREVAGASRSYYAELLEAGVDIREYVGGLLHSKTLTLDGEITLIGSANMDRRSFDLNFENNILIYDPELTQTVRARQRDYIDSANRITLEQVEKWSLTRCLWNNSVAMLGPIL
ncbi:cardiolipin synthase [Halioglobus sp. Uisw_031]|uniref:cardiolipin synthase n=1 Tax=Halioglobus sp. Uisw_031 TaxID=3230977 RepID=UPI0039E9CF51